MRSNHKTTNYKSTNFDEVGMIFKNFLGCDHMQLWNQKLREIKKMMNIVGATPD